jgi:hypothetical protein
MSVLLMSIASLLGSICSKTNLKSFKILRNFKLLLNDCLTRKSLQAKPIGGGEYQKLHSFFSRVDISHYISCPYAHQQNGSAEHKHHHIVEVDLVLLAHVSMPLKYWDEVFLVATYLINRLPTKVLDDTSPFERLFHEKPNYTGLCTLGARVGQISARLTHIYSNFAPINASSCTIAIFINGSSAWISQVGESIYPVM